MCKAMASEGTGSSVRKQGLPELATSAALTAAHPQIGGGPSRTLEALHQTDEASAFAAAGAVTTAADTAAPLPRLLPSTAPPVAPSLSGPSASSQSTELLFLHSSTSSALSGQYSVAAGLQEAMQQMQLQATAAAPSSSQQALQAAAASPAQASGSAGPQHTSQPSSFMAQAQQTQAQQQLEQGAQGEDGPATLFFAKVPRTATRQQVQELFARFGEVVSLNLFTPYENSPTSKGCGLVVMRGYVDAASAIAGLDSYKWEGMHSAMVVKLMPPQRQRHEQGASQLEGAGSGGSAGLRSPAQASSSRMGPAGSPMARSSYAPAGQMRTVMGIDVPPPGCAPNAYKLFVGNIPRAYSEPDLLPIFESIGPVRELVVLRDRATQESKGSAFLWYTTGEDADKAQMAFNMQLVLQSRSGANSRPLVVRRAAPSKQSPLAGMGGGTVGVAAYPPAQLQQAYALSVPQGAYVQPANPGSYAYAPSLVPVSVGMTSPQLYYDAHGNQVAVMPQGAYLQQQQQQVPPPPPQQQQQAPQGQQLWHQQQQQHMPSLVHGQGPQPAQYGAPVLLPVSEGPLAAYTQVLQVPHGSWQAQQQQQQLQQLPAYVGTGYEYSQAANPGGIPGQSPGAITFGAAEYAQPSRQQQQQPGLVGAVMMSSVPQAIPAGQQLSVGGPRMLPQAAPVLSGSSLSPASNVLLSGSAGSSTSSNVGPLASYQQLSSQHHSLSMPLSAEQFRMINSQLQSVMSMSGTSITAEQNFACGSLALNVIAASRQQLNVAWQIIQGLLGQASGPAGQVAEGMM